MSAMPQSPGQSHGQDGARTEPLLAAFAEASAILSLQRSVLSAHGQEPAPTHAIRELQPLLDDPQGGSAMQHMSLLNASLSEIHNRLRQISAALPPRDDFETMALDVYSSAMHRIRTCLDVALGCTEEIGEISDHDQSRDEVAAAAAEASRALRLVYHYSHELNDMASLRALIFQTNLSAQSSNLALAEAAEGLARIASDAAVALSFETSSEQTSVTANAALLVRTLRYLILMAIVSPTATAVKCGVRAIRTPDGPMVEFTISDNGRGLSIETRANVHSVGALEASGDSQKPAADLAGFAIARRLAKALKGSVSLEVIAGRGSKVSLVIPQLVPSNPRVFA